LLLFLIIMLFVGAGIIVLPSRGAWRVKHIDAEAAREGAEIWRLR
jgi:hypothetical protein